MAELAVYGSVLGNDFSTESEAEIIVSVNEEDDCALFDLAESSSHLNLRQAFIGAL